MMVFVNEAITWEAKPVAVLQTFLQLLATLRPAPGGGAVGEAHRPDVRLPGVCALAEVRRRAARGDGN